MQHVISWVNEVWVIYKSQYIAKSFWSPRTNLAKVYPPFQGLEQQCIQDFSLNGTPVDCRVNLNLSLVFIFSWIDSE